MGTRGASGPQPSWQLEGEMIPSEENLFPLRLHCEKSELDSWKNILGLGMSWPGTWP